MDDESKMGDVETQRRRLLKVLYSEANDEECARCLSGIDEYVTAQLAGEDYLSNFADIALHLDRCMSCAATYARLYELESATELAHLVQLENIPAPDLSYLDPNRARAQLFEQIRDSISRAGEQLTLKFTAGLFSSLQPSPVALRSRAPSDSQLYGDVLLLLDPAELPELDLPISVIAYEHLQQSQSCLVEVIVKPPGTSWPDLGERKVTLRFDDTTYQNNTDAWGVASFEDVPVEALSQMRIEVSLKG